MEAPFAISFNPYVVAKNGVNSEFPRRTVLKVSEASLQFMPVVDVRDHQAAVNRSRSWSQAAGKLFTFGITEAFKSLVSAFMSGRPSKPLLMQ